MAEQARVTRVTLYRHFPSTGAVVSGALDRNPSLNADFLDCWEQLTADGSPQPA